ncbi:Acetyl esterase/lipase [Hyphomicrobiales bacterium]|nr:Acetyl esterase/lipase [Hyphomicrobiales bacterium]CAH1671440.1 Acetyl esterase/lipase [Hyphomicrobiales bacterium]
MSGFSFPISNVFTAPDPKETLALNAQIRQALAAAPDQWLFSPNEIRERRKRGQGPFPVGPSSPDARTISIPGKHGPIPLRVFDVGSPTGVYLHMHGGGFVLGGADAQDTFLERIRKDTGMTVISVDYRLAPENAYPQGIDDCETAALWLVENGKTEFGTNKFAVGGESAGAHLAVTSLLRLRDRFPGNSPFLAANLCSGSFDLRLSASARNWGTDKLVLNTRDIRIFLTNFLQGQSPDLPEVSPILADLSGMPPALFSVGTLDPFLDDSQLMASRWAAAGGAAEIDVFQDGAHVFMLFPGALADMCMKQMAAFLSKQMSAENIA